MAYGSAIGGALGALGGGLLPIPGASIAGGALGGLLGSQFDPSKPRSPIGGNQIKGLQQVQRFTPQQNQALNQLLSSSSSGLQNPYQGFEGIEQQARRDFTTKTIPSIAERFTSLGGPGGQRSSSFAGSLGGAASDLESSLAGLRSQYGMQNRGQMLQALQMGLQPSFENVRLPHEPGMLEGVLSQLISQAGPRLPEIIQLLQQYLSRNPQQGAR